jgi:hypothetical protein
MSFFRTIKSPDRFSQGAGEVILERFDYDISGNLVYQGVVNNTVGPEDSDVWAIAKFTYDGDDRLVRTEYRYLVAWTERAILDWIV